MKKTAVYVLFCICCSINISGQSNWIWANSQSCDSGFSGYGTSVCTDTNGNVFATGGFESPTLTIGSFTLSNFQAGIDTNDVFITKFDSNGNAIWAKSVGGESHDIGYSISTDYSGNVFVTGTFYSPSISFGFDTLTNMDATGYTGDIFIAKYDSNGNELWAKSIGGHGFDFGKSLSSDASGNVILTGIFNSDSIRFDTSLFVMNGNWDMFIAKFDASGNIIWATNAGGIGNDQALSVCTDQQENIFVTGFFESPSIAFGNTVLSNSGWSSLFLVKYDRDGNVIWSKTENGNNNDKSYSVSTDNLGNAFITGFFQSSTITFDTITLSNSGWRDIFLAKYDPTGNILWAKSAGGESDEEGYCLSTDFSGNVFLTGCFTSFPLDFGNYTLNYPSNLSGSIVPMFVVKYDGNGNVLCGSALTSNGGDYQGVCTDHSGNAFVSGNFSSNPFIVGNDSLNILGEKDIFIAKFMAECDLDFQAEFSNEVVISVFPNPSNGIFTIQNQNINSEMNLEIYNVLGEKIRLQKLTSEKTEIDLSNQANGIYFITIKTEKETYSQKIIVQR